MKRIGVFITLRDEGETTGAAWTTADIDFYTRYTVSSISTYPNLPLSTESRSFQYFLEIIFEKYNDYLLS